MYSFDDSFVHSILFDSIHSIIIGGWWVLVVVVGGWVVLWVVVGGGWWLVGVVVVGL
ncbi:hypothetical protein THIOSC13_370007 [uncultured Thiomicrorhabdus sp.]